MVRGRSAKGLNALLVAPVKYRCVGIPSFDMSLDSCAKKAPTYDRVR